ncbi:MAG: hypothetical protein AAF628_01640 [Planctomycetota bacterium]
MPAQVATSLGDLEPGFVVQSSSPQFFAEGGGLLFCSAQFPSIGQELAVIDLATRAVTAIDIYSRGWSMPENLVYHAGHLWFSALADPSGDRTLFMSDGTVAGTRPVPLPGVSGRTDIEEIAPFGNSIVFSGSDGVSGLEPWIVDVAGTNPRPLAQIVAGSGPSSPSDFTEFQGQIYFRACDGVRGCALWRTDGTPAGTEPAVAGSARQSVTDLLVLNDRLVLHNSTFGVGREPYWLDVDQLELLADTRPGTGSGGRLDLRAAIGNQIVFHGDQRLWVTDATVAGTMAVPTAAPTPWAVHPAGNRAVFWSFGSTELWATDGTAAGTQSIFDLDPGTGTVRMMQGEAAELPGGRAVFSLDDGGSTGQLWVSDGTTAGTALLHSFTGPSPRPRGFYRSPTSGRVFFRGRSVTAGFEVWETDGTVGGTRLFANLVPESPVGSDPRDACDLLDRTLFSARTLAAGRELWVTDGTAAGTSMLLDLEPGPTSSEPSQMTRVGNLVVFAATTSASGSELWVTNGTTAGTRLLVDLLPGSIGSDPQGLSAVDGEVWFSAADPQAKIWRTDGTALGTVAVTSGSPGVLGTDFTRVGADVFFAQLVPGFFGGFERAELWVTDGTAAGTRLVKDIYPGFSYCGYPYYTCPNHAAPQDLVAWNDRLWFTARNDVVGREIWVSDGTTAGTVLAVDHSTTGSMNEMVLFADHLWFSGRETVTGSELWRSDGTPAGTALFAELRPGPASSQPADFARLGNATLLFTAADDAKGREVWLTDGTVAGTQLAVDLQPGPGSGAGEALRRAADAHAAVGYRGGALLAADDGSTGTELFRLDVGAVATPVHPGGTRGVGPAPTLTTGDPIIGQTVGLQGNAPVAGSAAVVIVGLPAPSILSFAGLPIYFDAIQAFYALAAIPAAGSWQTALPLPNNPALAGARVALQALTTPSSGVGTFDVSNGIVWVLNP